MLSKATQNHAPIHTWLWKYIKILIEFTISRMAQFWLIHEHIGKRSFRPISTSQLLKTSPSLVLYILAEHRLCLIFPCARFLTSELFPVIFFPLVPRDFVPGYHAELAWEPIEMIWAMRQITHTRKQCTSWCPISTSFPRPVLVPFSSGTFDKSIFRETLNQKLNWYCIGGKHQDLRLTAAQECINELPSTLFLLFSNLAT